MITQKSEEKIYIFFRILPLRPRFIILTVLLSPHPRSPQCPTLWYGGAGQHWCSRSRPTSLAFTCALCKLLVVDTGNFLLDICCFWMQDHARSLYGASQKCCSVKPQEATLDHWCTGIWWINATASSPLAPTTLRYVSCTESQSPSTESCSFPATVTYLMLHPMLPSFCALSHFFSLLTGTSREAETTCSWILISEFALGEKQNQEQWPLLVTLSNALCSMKGARP